MFNYSCECRSGRVSGVTTLSVILGIVATFLRLTATVTVGTTFLWAVFAAAIAYLGGTLLVSAVSARCATLSRCACPLLTALLVGSLGSVLLAVILLTVTFTATGIVGALLFGLLVLFFALMLLSTAALARHIARCEE